jgi:hypothetical protein
VGANDFRLFERLHTRIRDAVAALPVDSAVLDGEAAVLMLMRTASWRLDYSFSLTLS